MGAGAPSRPAGVPPAPPARADAAAARALEAWFRANRRDLPWRPAHPAQPRDPYRVLVSELMLQQTQVSRVVERYTEFLARFPDVRALAAADEQEVLALWSGLGYYRRARLLHAAARAVVHEHDAAFPGSARSLESLPGVGRYTAGAIASLAFAERAPVVDGNVTRVLMRLHARNGTPDDRETTRWVWARAGALVQAAESPGVLNESLMELGATVCTPRAPACDRCPLARRCGARLADRQDEIPPPKARAQRSVIYCDAIRVTDARGRLLVTRRPDTGLWAGLWQAPTTQRDDRHARPADVRTTLALERGPRLDEFVHRTTHREVRFRVWEGALGARTRPPGTEWKSRAETARLALSSPQRRILLGA